MKIYVDVLPKEPQECLFCYEMEEGSKTPPLCNLKRGMRCRIQYGGQCPYLKRGVSEIDLLFT